MYSLLTGLLNDEHRRDLLREARAERLANDIRQASVVGQARTPAPRTPFLSVGTLLYQAGISRSDYGRAALCGDERS